MLDDGLSRGTGILDAKSEDLLARLRGISIRFDETPSANTASRETLSRLNTQIASETLPGSGSRPSSESRDYLLQSFSRYRDQLRDDFDQLRTTVTRRTGGSTSNFHEREREPEHREREGRSLRQRPMMDDLFREPIPFVEPEQPVSREPAIRRPAPLSDTVRKIVEPLREPVSVESRQPEICEVPIVEKRVEVPTPEEKPTVRNSDNPFSKMVHSSEASEHKATTKARSSDLWGRNLLYFAAGGIACGGVLLGLAFLEGQPRVEVWNLGFSFLISGTASLLASGAVSWTERKNGRATV